MSTLLEPASAPCRDNYIVAAFMAGRAGLAPPAALRCSTGCSSTFCISDFVNSSSKQASAGRRAGPENHAVVYSKDYLGRCSPEEVLFGIVGGPVAGFEDLAPAQRGLLNQ